MGFTIPIGQLAEKMKADLDTVVRKSTLMLFDAVKQKSPVGNPDLWKSQAPPGYVGGRFRANWNVSHNAIDDSTTASTDTSRMDREIARVLTIPAGGVVYLANGLPYATALEHGHSTQAPQGMVRLSALEFSDYVQRAISK